MRRVFAFILLALGLAGCQQPNAASAKAQFVFVKIPEQITPIERAEKYEDPLDTALAKENVGQVSGGGTQLSTPDARGKQTVRWVGVDVDLSDFEKGMVVLKSELLRLGVPPDTVLVYTRNGRDIEENLR